MGDIAIDLEKNIDSNSLKNIVEPENKYRDAILEDKHSDHVSNYKQQKYPVFPYHQHGT